MIIIEPDILPLPMHPSPKIGPQEAPHSCQLSGVRSSFGGRGAGAVWLGVVLGSVKFAQLHNPPPLLPYPYIYGNEAVTVTRVSF